MDTGKVKIVLNALRDELQARRATAAKRTAGSADDAPVLPASALPGETSSPVELANTSIAEVAVPFRMSDEPLVTIAPYVAIAVLAGVVLLGLMLLVF
jgi:hypothetical protein